jgi:multidrug efflux pump subunit AcrA (membrane-fusion protein)
VVTTGTIHTIVSGSGVLTEEDLEEISVPSGVTVNEVMVDAGDTVRKGDLLATVDMATVMTSLSSLQEQMDALDKSINAAKGEEAGTQIMAGVSGRVKILYAEENMDVSLCMAEHGALAVLSLDGYMALDLETDQLSKGDLVTVTREDGKVYEGKVSAAAGKTVTVLVTDNGPQYGEKVTVSTKDGVSLGQAELYIHNPLGVTGYAGTVRNVVAKENTAVTAQSVLFNLKDTSFSANYDTLLRDRADLEETLMELLTIYRDGALLAPMDGMISSVEFDDEDSVSFSAAASSSVAALYGYSTTTTTAAAVSEGTILTLYPDLQMRITIGIDETDILALEEGQEAEIVVSSVGDEVYPGSVAEISKVADTSTGVTQYSAEVLLDKAPGMLPGMTADVDIKIKGAENALIIPVEALHQTSRGSFVYTFYDQETKQYGGRVDVVPGMQNDTYAEILSGLKEGDTVYYTKQENIFAYFASMMGGGMGGGMPSGGGMPGGMPPGGQNKRGG